jgi:acetyl esterase
VLNWSTAETPVRQTKRVMKIGLDSLMDAEVAAYAEESRAVYAARAASRGTDPQPDPSPPAGLQAVRALEQGRATGAVSPASPGVPAVETLAEVAGRRVPVRILAPESGTVRGSTWTFMAAVSTWG